MNLLKRSAIGASLVAAAMMAGTAHAGTVTLSVGGIASNGALGDPTNETRYIDILAGVQITNISWNVSFATEGSSWLSEIGVDLNNGAAGGVSLFAGIGDDFAGTGSYSGSADLIALGADFFLDSTGRLNFEFFEYFDDFVGATDATWLSGDLTVTYVPEPATFGLAALALLGAGATTRRRKS
ncbi:PEP-CTERM sorting domain-containing protein [Roseateles asaccharophilus]|uniref:Ice-binding protein C-terminal domain-containing protein n=1 Tax=Roseateles asaccharophilus TaxID=582607 RepID=A0ABU2ADD3_9BURK|nr:PEP-CTERM sorting domain-containing protein [Roseateles asaccharophilus]MDR7335190.1 hypothetical protein [Roseateles asaccharophilus]